MNTHISSIGANSLAVASIMYMVKEVDVHAVYNYVAAQLHSSFKLPVYVIMQYVIYSFI